MFEGDYKIRFHMAPPLLAGRDKETGHLMKMELGSYMLRVFKIMAKLRFLRGTIFDPFGYTAERKEERALIKQYEEKMERLAKELAPDNHAIAVGIASIPEHIRGYGHIKDAHLKKAQMEEKALWAAFEKNLYLQKQAAE
jgi:indolepyruvate ferredoxin oxidoreductase